MPPGGRGAPCPPSCLSSIRRLNARPEGRGWSCWGTFSAGGAAGVAATRVSGSPVTTAHPESDVDVGVEPLRGRRLSAQDRVRVMQRLEAMLASTASTA